MENAKWQNAILPVTIISLGFITGIVIQLVLGAYVPANVRAEVKDWKWNTYPMVCKPPSIHRGLDLTDSEWADAKRAIPWINKQSLLKRKLFTTAHSKGQLKVFIHKAQKPCRNNINAYIVRTPIFAQHTLRFDVFLCTNKIKHAVHYTGTDDSIRTTGRLGIFGHTVHELLHIYMGDRVGHNHPVTGNGIMLKSPRYITIGPVVRGILKRVERVCK